jgi:hypothetical protein
MIATLDGVTRNKRPEPTAEAEAATELVRLARERGLALTGPDGLLEQLTKTVIETALNEEMTGHLGHEKTRPRRPGRRQRERPERDPAEDGAHRRHGSREARRAAGPGRDVRAADRGCHCQTPFRRMGF